MTLGTSSARYAQGLTSLLQNRLRRRRCESWQNQPHHPMTERAIRRKFELLKRKLQILEAGMIEQRLGASGAASNELTRAGRLTSRRVTHGASSRGLDTCGFDSIIVCAQFLCFTHVFFEDGATDYNYGKVIKLGTIL